MFEIHINQEVQFLTHVFVENRQRRSFLKNLVHDYQNKKKENHKTKSFEVIKK